MANIVRGVGTPWTIDTASGTPILAKGDKWCGYIRWEVNDGSDTDTAVVQDADGNHVVTFNHDGTDDEYNFPGYALTRKFIDGLLVPTLSAGLIVIIPISGGK